MNRFVKIKKRYLILISAGYMLLLFGGSPARAYFVDSFVGDLGINLSSKDVVSNLGVGVPDINYTPDPTVAGSVDVAHVPEPSTWILFLFGVASFLLQFSKRVYTRVKKIFDFTVALIALVLLSPVMLIIAVLIKLDSPGPIFYTQKRVGLNRRRRSGKNRSSTDSRNENKLGRPFEIYKFRTMYCDAESKKGAVWAKKDDSRVTRVGKILRKTRLDEIPQFFNVLKGEMSIIGPRPERPEFVCDLNKSIHYYHRRYDMKPGITGLAQTRFKYVASVQDTRKKLKYDLLYLKKMCFFLDLNIIFSTFVTVILARGT